MKKMKLTTLSIVLASVGLSACSNLTQNIDKNIARDEKMINTVLKQSSNNVPPPKNNFKQSSDIYINPTPLPTYVVNKKPLPALFKNKIEVTMPRAVPVNEVINEISRSYYQRYKNQLNFDVSQDVYNPNAGVGSLLTNAPTAPVAANAAQTGANANQATINGLSSSQINNVLIDSFVYDGSLESALNLIAQKTGTSWEWNGSGVEFYRFKVKNYYISALSGSLSSTSTISSASKSSTENSNSGSSSSGAIQGGSRGNQGGLSNSTGQTLTSESKINQLEEITTYIRSMLSPSGRISIMESTGIVTVRDTPMVHEGMEKAIRELNAVLSKQINVNLEIYVVEVNERDNLGLDWNLVWSAAGSKYNFGYKSLTNAAGFNSGSVGVTNGNFAGSNVLLGLNSSLGRVVNGTSSSIVTQNGKITPIVLTNTVEYIRSITSTTGTTNGTATTAPTYTATPATASTGIDAKVQARIQPDGKILLKLNMNMSELKELRTFQVGSGQNASTVQLANNDLRNIEQEITLRSSQSLVLSGFKQFKNTKSNTGTGNPYNMILGGGSRQADSKDVQLVIIVTPYLIENND